MQPHIQDILELVKAALLDENHSDPVYGLAHGIIGDLAEIFGSQIKPLLLQDWLAAELKSRRCPPESKQTMRWAREVWYSKLFIYLSMTFLCRWSNAPLRKYRPPFFSRPTQGLPPPPYNTYFTGPTFALAIFFLPWVRYTFLRVLCS